MEGGRGTEERKYVQISNSTITDYAESVGIAGLPGSVAKELAGDITYRLREIADACSQFLRHSRKRTLTTEILNKVFKCKKIEPVLGHAGTLGTQYPGQHGFQYITEADRMVDADQEVDLVTESLNMSESGGSVAEMDMKVSCSWLAIQGVPCGPGEDDVKVNPASYNLSPALQQFYSTLTSHIVGESQQLCLMAVQELRRNARMTPLLPYLVTFARWCLVNKYKDDPVITARIIRLISALISNPHVNLSPKPYLSYLVSALLSFLINDRGENGHGAIEHVQLAASVLSDALDRWATPTNQLSFRTLCALTKNCQNHLSHIQLGALTALRILGPTTIQSGLLPVYESLLTNLMTSFQDLQQQPNQPDKSTIKKLNYGNQSLGLVRLIGLDFIHLWQQTGGDVSESNVRNMYHLLYSHFGDSVFLPPSKQITFPLPAKDSWKLPRARIRVRLVKKINSQGGQDRRFSSQQHPADNFSFLADMGMPSEIFEPCGDFFGGQGGVAGDTRLLDTARTVKLSKSVIESFPEVKPIKVGPRLIRLSSPACTPMKIDTSKRKRLPVKEKTVACTHMVTASKLKFLTKSLSQSNYIDLFSNFIF